MDFNQYYFNNKNLTEVNWLKSRFFSNALRAITGSGKRRVNPRDFKKFTELTPAGYSEMFTSLSNRYEKTGGTKVSSLKYFIQQAFTAIFDPQKAQNIFPYKDQDGTSKFVEFTRDPKTQVKAASYYTTNKGGRLMLVYLEDDNEVDRYYIGLDGNALKFFVAPIKQGGFGRDFRTWLAAQAASTYQPDQKTMSPEFLGKGEKTNVEKKDIQKLTKIPINQRTYNMLAPITAATKKESNLLKKSNDLLNLFEDNVIEEKDIYVFKKDNKWYNAAYRSGSEQEINPIAYDPKNKYIAVVTSKGVAPTKGTGKGYEAASNLPKDTNNQKELDQYIDKLKNQSEEQQPKEIDGKKTVRIGKSDGEYKNKWVFIDKNNKEIGEVPDNDFKQDNLIGIDIHGKPEDVVQKSLNTEIEKRSQKKSSQPITSADESTIKDNGKLYNDLKDEITEKPAKVKSPETKEGWRYILKNNGVIFIYQSTINDKYYLSYNEPAAKKAKELIKKYNLETVPETPTEGYTIWDYLNKII